MPIPHGAPLPRRRLAAVLAAALAFVTLTACATTTPVVSANPTHVVTMAPPLPADPTPTTSPEPAVPPGFTLAEVAPVVNNGPRTGNQVALTFDADMTPGMATRMATVAGVSYANLTVIKLLEDRHIPATFFITGMWAKQYPDVMRRLADNPIFDIANHTWDHGAYTAGCYTLPLIPAAEMANELTRTFATIRAYQGHQTNYFRFPGLCYNAAALRAIAPCHVTVVHGDVISADPGATAAAPIVRAVLNKVQAGSIVIMHITEDNARFTDEALPEILDGIAQKGLQPVRLSTLLAA